MPLIDFSPTPPMQFTGIGRLSPYDRLTGADRLPKARIDQLEECTQRYLGKLVRSEADHGRTKIGVVERVCSQYDAWDGGDRDLLVIVMRTIEGRKQSSWIVHDLIEVWGDATDEKG